MKNLKNFIGIACFLILVTGIGLFFYKGHKVEAAEEAAQNSPPPTPVEISVVTPRKAQVWKNFSGHVVAVDFAEIRPQISGRITDIRFEDGQDVQKGDVLIVIDPRPYEAALDQAKSALTMAKTQAEHAEKEFQRAQKLIGTEAISQSLLDDRTNNRETAVAAVKGAQALVETAKINLDYAYVKAPISGKTSRAEITVGNLVQAGNSAPLLTSIVSDEKVYVDFEIDEKTYMDSAKTENLEGNSNIPVQIKLSEDKIIDGFIKSFDNKIDPASGTIRARAIFNNENKLLLPGMSISIMMGTPEEQDKILVSERAIGTDQDRKFVYIVNTDNSAEYREVKIGDSIQGKRIILSGLNEGEKIITDGLVRIRPGMPVTSKSDVKPETSSPPEDQDLKEKE